MNFCGLCKTGKKSGVRLAIYGVSTLILGLGLIVGAAWLNGFQIGEKLSSQLVEVVIPADVEDQPFSQAIVSFQERKSCCGISFREVDDPINNPSQVPTCAQWQYNRPFGCDCDPKISDPDSCISYEQASKTFNCKFPENNPSQNTSTGYIYKNGCVDIMVDSVDFYISFFDTVAVIVGVCMFVASIMAITLCCGLKNEKEKRKEQEEKWRKEQAKFEKERKAQRKKMKKWAKKNQAFQYA